jgi:hypothetical protein
VLYPATGTTKADVIAYYAAVANVMVPHLTGRPATRKRWPDGVTGEAFFVKQVEAGIPVWLSRVQITHHRAAAFYPVLDTPAALAWLGQVAALEVHVPHRCATERRGSGGSRNHPDPAGPLSPPGQRKSAGQIDSLVDDIGPGGSADAVRVPARGWAPKLVAARSAQGVAEPRPVVAGTLPGSTAFDNSLFWAITLRRRLRRPRLSSTRRSSSESPPQTPYCS